jgi:AcrR family transcriptional regulator
MPAVNHRLETNRLLDLTQLFQTIVSFNLIMMPTESQSTRDRLLDAAERLFGQQGFPCSSLRQITDEAGVNLAAVNYHFRSKEELYKAVLLRRIRPVNDERMKLLTDAEQLAGDQPVPIRSILEVFIRPLLRRAADGSLAGLSFLRLISRDLTDPQPFMVAEMVKEFDPLVGRFARALTQALPDIPLPELFWRMQFSIGGMLYAAAHQRDFERTSCGLCRGDDLEGCVQRLIDFCAAGLAAQFSALEEQPAFPSANVEPVPARP